MLRAQIPLNLTSFRLSNVAWIHWRKKTWIHIGSADPFAANFMLQLITWWEKVETKGLYA